MTKRPAKPRVPTVGELFDMNLWECRLSLNAMKRSQIDSREVMSNIAALRAQLDAIESAHRKAVEGGEQCG